jgi:hypothetical protein
VTPTIQINMLETEREGFYWRISLFFMVISPWILYCLAKLPLNPFMGLALFKVVITIGMFSSIAIVVLLEMLYVRLTKGQVVFKFWLVNPSVDYSGRAMGSVQGCTQAIEKKLINLGFQTEIVQDSSAPAEGKCIQFKKTANKPVHNFLDHAFSGQLSLAPGFNGVEIKSKLTLEDTLILESGELNKIQQVNEFIALKSTEIQMKGVPFTLYCGLIFAYGTIVTGFALGMGWTVNYAMFNSLALSAIGTLALSLFYSFKNGKDFMGWRLVFSGLYLAAVPYLGWMLGKALG